MFSLNFTLLRKTKSARYRPAVQALEGRYLLSTFQEFSLPALQRNPLDEFHRERITTGPDGNLWFTDGVPGRAAVGRIAPDGSVTEFSIEQNTQTQLYNITAGPDGNLWMLAIRTPTGTNDDQLVAIQMTPDGNYTVFGAFLGHNGEDFVSNVSSLVVGPDGNLWYTASFYTQFPLTNQGSIIGRITPTGDVTNFAVGLFDIAQFGVGGGIAAGPDGNLWVAIGDGIHGEPQGVRRVSPDGQLSDVIPGSHPLSEMLTEANGNVWGLIRPGPFGTVIERITPDGTVSDFPLPVHEPFDSPELDPCRMTITTGPDGNIWFSDPYANQIGNIAPDGTVTEYAVPTPDSFPAGITTGPDGNIWFTELGSGQIGELILDGGGSAPAQSAALTQVVHSAAIDSHFASTKPEALMPDAASQNAVAVDTAFASSALGVDTITAGPLAHVESGGLFHSHHGDQAVMHEVGGLTDDPAEVL